MKSFMKNIALILIGILGIPFASYANLPVIDFSNLIQNSLTAEKAVVTATQTAAMVNNMITNTTNPTSFIWNQSDQTINTLLNATDTLTQYENRNGGSVDSYFNKYYQDTQYYRSLSCFNGGQCSSEQLQTLLNEQAYASEAEQKANDAELQNVAQQQKSLKSDSQKIVNLQQQASIATGRLAAVQAGNQLASAQANQLLQVRALLVSQQTAEATRQAAITNKEAIQQAADENFRSGSFAESTPSNW